MEKNAVRTTVKKGAPLKLYRLERAGRAGLDEASGYVVAAISPTHARRAIVESKLYGPGGEGPETWLDQRKSGCFLIGTAAKSVEPGAVLQAFLNG